MIVGRSTDAAPIRRLGVVLSQPTRQTTPSICCPRIVSSTAIADREYAAVASRFGSFTSGAEKRVQEVTAANGSTVYRTTFTGMSRERAVAFCNALKAAGRDCIVR